MKKILTLALSACMLSAVANAVVINDVAYTLHDDGTASVSSYQAVSGGRVTDGIVVFDSFDCEGANYTVTAVDEYAYYDQTGLTDITLPATITSIGAYAFAGCKNLDHIYIFAVVPPAIDETATADASTDANDGDGAFVMVPYGTAPAYKATAWATFKGIIDENAPDGEDDFADNTDTTEDMIVFTPCNNAVKSSVGEITLFCDKGLLLDIEGTDECKGKQTGTTPLPLKDIVTVCNESGETVARAAAYTTVSDEHAGYYNVSYTFTLDSEITADGLYFIKVAAGAVAYYTGDPDSTMRIRRDSYVANLYEQLSTFRIVRP